MPISSPKVRPDKAAEKIEQFLRDGASVQTIADSAGLHATVIHRIRSGRVDLIERETQTKILNAKPKIGPHIEITGTRRKLQAMAALGYSLEDASGGTGLKPSTVTNIRTGKKVTTSPEFAAVVDQFYEIIKDTPAAPSAGQRRAISFAVKYNWAPPQAWEGRDINDPNVGPGQYDVD